MRRLPSLIAAAGISWMFAGALFAADCRLVSGPTCVEGAETRMIDGISVYADCWKYSSTYDCLEGGTIAEDSHCADLRAQGCTQIGSDCITYSGDTCITYEQTYECPSGEQPVEQTVLDCGGQLFCADGNCFDMSYDPNPNMAEAAARFAVMAEMSHGLAADSVEVFKGEDRRCGVSVFDRVGAQNCCRLDGWAEGNLKCSFDEETLADLRQAGRCHYVGTYCSNEDDLGICWVNTQTHCCFASKLARIVAEQGRPQLDRGWGTATEPACGGFAADEIRLLDFQAMDLSEFYSDVIASMPIPDQNSLQQQMTDRVDRLMP